MPVNLPRALPALWKKGLLLWGLGTGDIAHTGPIFVDLHLTNRCNLNCRCCVYHSPNAQANPTSPQAADLPYARVKELFRELKAMGTASIVLQGAGEPLLHPQALDIIALAKRHGFETILLTNGTLLNEDKINSMIDSRHDLIKIALWATSPEEYAMNYPGTSSQMLETVQNNFKLAARLKRERSSRLPLVYWHYPINAHNWRSLDRLVELAHAAGCDGVTFAPLCQSQKVDPSNALEPDETGQIVAALQQIGKRMNRLGMRHNVPQVVFRYRTGEEVWRSQACYIAWYHAHMRVDGRVQPCARCADVFGNLAETNFKEIWNNATAREFRRRTRTRDGVASMQSECECRYCCYTIENARIERIYAPVTRFAKAARGDA